MCPDFFFFIAFLLQLVFLVPTQTSAEVRSVQLAPVVLALTRLSTQRWITVAALPLALFVLLLGYFSVKLEHRAGFWGFVTGCAVAMGYFIYKVRSVICIFESYPSDQQPCLCSS